MTTMARSGQAAPAGAGRLERGVRPHSVRSRQRAEGAMCKGPARTAREGPRARTSKAPPMRCCTEPQPC